MKKEYLLFLIGTLLLFTNCKKQIETTDFDDHVSLNTIDAGGDDYAVKIFKAPDGGYLLLGNTYITGKKYEVFLTKVNSKGYIEKTTLYGGADNDLIFDATADAQGNILAVGKTASPELFLGGGFFASQYYLLYFDASGNVKWHTGYTDLAAPYANANVEDFATQTIPDGNGSFWVSGCSRAYASYPPNPFGINPTYSQATLFKIDANKNVTKTKSFSLYINDSNGTHTTATKLMMKPNGNFNLVINKLYPELPASVKPNFRILEFKSNGDSIGVFQGWTQNYITKNATQLVAQSNGSYAFVYSPDARFSNFSNTGAMLTKKILAIAQQHQSWMASNCLTANNGIYFCGSLASRPVDISQEGLLNVDNNIPLLVKTDWDGNILWTKKMDVLNGIMNDILLNADGSFIIFGTYKPNGVKTADLFMVKYNKEDIIINP